MSELSRLLKKAEKRPLKVCLSHGDRAGLDVGIPPKLRDYRDPLFDLVPANAKVAVEIGTMQGWFAWRCLKFLPAGCHIYSIDPHFDSEPYGDGSYNRDCYLKNMSCPESEGRAVLVPQTGVEAAISWPEDRLVDFIFIDGGHTKEDVLADLRGWFPLMRPGALLSGHDISGTFETPVKAALEEFAAEAGIPEIHIGEVYSFTGTQVTDCWWFYKGGK